jgi:hypothetical protein
MANDVLERVEIRAIVDEEEIAVLLSDLEVKHIAHVHHGENVTGKPITASH